MSSKNSQDPVDHACPQMPIPATELLGTLMDQTGFHGDLEAWASKRVQLGATLETDTRPTSISEEILVENLKLAEEIVRGLELELEKAKALRQEIAQKASKLGVSNYRIAKETGRSQPIVAKWVAK